MECLAMEAFSSAQPSLSHHREVWPAVLQRREQVAAPSRETWNPRPLFSEGRQAPPHLHSGVTRTPPPGCSGEKWLLGGKTGC
jgi:hypothetical protein